MQPSIYLDTKLLTPPNVHAFKGSLVKRTQWVKILFLFKKLVKYLYSTHTKKKKVKF